MPVLDWIFAAILLTSMLLGALRGFVYEVLSLISWVAAFVLAQWLALDAGHRLPISGASDTVRYASGFVLVFVGSLMLGGVVAVVVKKLMASVGLRPVDRALGAVFGLTRGMLLSLLGCALVMMTPLQESAAWQDSTGARFGLIVLKGIKPVVPPELERFLPA